MELTNKVTAVSESNGDVTTYCSGLADWLLIIAPRLQDLPVRLCKMTEIPCLCVGRVWLLQIS